MVLKRFARNFKKMSEFLPTCAKKMIISFANFVKLWQTIDTK